MWCLSSILASMFVVMHYFFIFSTSTYNYPWLFKVYGNPSWAKQRKQPVLLLLLFFHLIGENLSNKKRYVVSVSKLIPFLSVFFLFSSEPKLNYSHHTITWQTTRLCGHQGQTWNKGVVALAGSGRDLLSICAAERGRLGEPELKSNLKI